MAERQSTHSIQPWTPVPAVGAVTVLSIARLRCCRALAELCIESSSERELVHN